MRKTFYVITGLPGSGKTSIAKKLLERLWSRRINGVMCAADDFFMVEEQVNVGTEDSEKFALQPVYKFDPTKLPLAHSDCFANVLKAFQEEVQIVILHNTGSQLWEYENYLRAARLVDYDIVIAHIPCKSKEQFLEFYGRNTHGIPLAAAAMMWLRWEHHKQAIGADELFCAHLADSAIKEEGYTYCNSCGMYVIDD